VDELGTAFELTPDEFLRKYNVSKPNKEQNIVFSCAKGIRSLKASHHVVDLGYKKYVFLLLDGIYPSNNIFETICLCFFFLAFSITRKDGLDGSHKINKM